ncbi:MAG: hypothetical protein WD751_03790 [Anaerolineales bacterium]
MSRKLVAFSIPALVLAAVAITVTGCQMAPEATPSISAEIPLASTATQSPTSIPEALAPVPVTYDWRGTTLTLNAALPAGPGEASVLLGHPDSPATIEEARALADQLGLQANVYAAPGEPGAFLIVDGNQRLILHTPGHFTYYLDYSDYGNIFSSPLTPADAEAQIAEFMQTAGFGMDYKVTFSESRGAYYALPLSPDGFPLRYPHFDAAGFQFNFNAEGIAFVDATFPSYELLESYGILSAEEALQKLLSPDPKYGTLEGFTSPSGPIQEWIREYPSDQTVTVYGWLNSTPSLEGGEPIVTLYGVTAIGDLTNIDESMPDTFVEATGRFHAENGVEFFVLDSWKVHSGFGEGHLGTLQRQGDQVVLMSSEGGELIMPDIPADVPLLLEDVYAMGVTVGDTFEWNAFDLRMANGGGGGGGGGGLGFYDVNLSGTPVPIPTLASAQPSIGEHLEGVRGTLVVSLFTQQDGSQRVEYSWLYMRGGLPYPTVVSLRGNVLDGLQAYHNQPVELWGEITGYDQFGTPYVDVERVEIPFTNLQFQILQGTQQTLQLEGQSAILFTADNGNQYVQVMPGGGPDSSLLGVEGEQVLLEGLIVPDESFGGYPTAHIFSGSVATGPKNGQSMELEITANQPAVMDEPQPQVQETYELPTASIDAVELVCLIPYPSYGLPDSDFYIQPMWHFTGHYSSGEEFEIFVQALKPEYLSPVIVTVEPPG